MRQGEEITTFDQRDLPSEDIFNIDAFSKQATENDLRDANMESEGLHQTNRGAWAGSSQTDGFVSHAMHTISKWVNSWRNHSPKAGLEDDGNAGDSRLANVSSVSARGVDRERKRYVEDTVEGMDIAYSKQVPNEAIEGLALLFHGCGQHAKDWYELPEHREIELQLRKHHLITLAFSAKNVVSGCWSTRFPPHKNTDVGRVSHALKSWLLSQKLPNNMTTHGVGISSGGTFLSIFSSLSNEPLVRSQVLYISPGSMRAFRRASDQYPNTLFVHLRNDEQFASRRAINGARHTLLGRNVPLVGELQLPTIRLHEWTLNSREPRFSMKQSRILYRAVNTCNKKIAVEAGTRLCGYQDVAWEGSEQTGLFAALVRGAVSRRALEQVLRVTSGQHEVHAENADKVAHWLKKHKRAKPRNDRAAIESR